MTEERYPDRGFRDDGRNPHSKSFVSAEPLMPVWSENWNATLGTIAASTAIDFCYLVVRSTPTCSKWTGHGNNQD